MLSLPAYVQSLRREVRYLRIHNALLLQSNTTNKDTVKTLKQEIRKLKQERAHLEKERNRLEKELEKLTKTTNRYRASLFDHGNFHSPGQEEKQSKGGQPGHANTNREYTDDASRYDRRRVFASSCFRCGHSLRRVKAIQQKTLIDIILNPQVVQLIIESERQWCGTCKKEISARDERSLPFTEYGINTFMMALLLRYRCLLSLSKISMVFAIGYGLDISESGLVSLLRQAATHLGGRYEELKRIVRAGHILYADETGLQVKGKGAWMWIMAGEEATVYVAAESRGKGIAQELYGTSRAYAMHDGLASYTNPMPKDKQLYCWAHLLRFCFEETVDKLNDHESVYIRDTLVWLYHLKKDGQYQRDPKQLEQDVSRYMDKLLAISSIDPTTQALQHRLREQRDGLIRTLLVSPNGTNNFAEQELRPIALARRISYGSDTYTGMETTATLASIVQTLVRTKREAFFPTLKGYLHTGFANS